MAMKLFGIAVDEQDAAADRKRRRSMPARATTLCQLPWTSPRRTWPGKQALIKRADGDDADTGR